MVRRSNAQQRAIVRLQQRVAFPSRFALAQLRRWHALGERRARRVRRRSRSRRDERTLSQIGHFALQLVDNGEVHAGNQCEWDDEREERVEHEERKEDSLICILLADDCAGGVRAHLRRRHGERQAVEDGGEREQCQRQDAVGSLLQERGRLHGKEDGDEPVTGVSQGEIRGEKRSDVTQVDRRHAHRRGHHGKLQLIEHDDDDDENEDQIGDCQAGEKERGAQRAQAPLGEDEDRRGVADQAGQGDGDVVGELQLRREFHAYIACERRVRRRG